MKTSRIILATLLAMLLSAALQAQSLSDAKCVRKGTLPNGVQWYIVTNNALSGTADIALVQKDFCNPAISCGALGGVPHFGSRRPVDFLSSASVGYTRDGFISYGSGSTVYDFRDVPVTDRAFVDSTLMYLTDLTATFAGPQAIIISGDVDAASLSDRLSLLSMTVPRRQKAAAGDTYRWEPSDTPTYFYSVNASDALASIRVSYSSPRVPRDKMNTLQPVVSRQYEEYLASILNRRIAESFRSAGIPLADVRFRYHESADGPGDEQCTITVVTSSADYSRAVELLAGILSNLDSKGAGSAEFSRAKALLTASARKQSGTMDNAAWVKRCISAYLYNASLASDSDVAAVFASGRLSGAKELELFNNYVSALLDPSANLTIGFDMPQDTLDSNLPAVFASGWSKGSDEQPRLSLRSGFKPSASKIKLRSDVKEPMTGGRLWTFSNGMRVVFCKKAGTGGFSYSMMIRGGSPLVENLAPGESAFVGDMLGICDVAGMRGSAFRDTLLTRGITLNPRVTLKSTVIRGDAPSSEIDSVLCSLLAIASDRGVNRAAYDYYRSCESLKEQMRRLSEDGVRDNLDSLISPGWEYSRRDVSALGDDFPERAEKFFSSQFSRCSDGVLVFIGDLNEDALKKSLLATLGGFRTGGTAPQGQSLVRKTTSGTVTRTGNAQECGFGEGLSGVWVANSAVTPFNLKSYMSFRVAAELLRGNLSAALAPLGGYAGVQYCQDLYPDERIDLYVTVKPCRADGLPEGVEPSSPLELLEAVRTAMRSLASSPVPEARLKAAKARITSEVESELADPGKMMDYVLLRYGAGKDFVTGCKDVIKSVDAASVGAVITALSQSGKIETVLM